jgi:hypothetical protein
MSQLTPEELHKLCSEVLAAIDAPHYGTARAKQFEVAIAAADQCIVEAMSLLVMTVRRSREKISVDEMQAVVKSVANAVARTAGQHQTIFNGDGTMANRDSYSAGQAGAQGPNAHAHDMTFQQIWANEGGSIQLPSVAEDLARLRTELKSRAKSPEEDMAIAPVAAAELAARRGDGPGMLKHLGECTRWALGVAKEIGVDIAASAICKAMKIEP